jgi:hypothetical protein
MFPFLEWIKMEVWPLALMSGVTFFFMHPALTSLKSSSIGDILRWVIIFHALLAVLKILLQLA